MHLKKISMRQSAIVLALITLGTVTAPLWAVANGPGLTIFSGVAGDKQLNYRMDFGGNPNAWDRYRLYIPKKKMKLAVAQFVIDYPNYFDGKFDPKSIELYVNKKKVAVQEAKWDEENAFIELYPGEPVPAGTDVEIHLSNVRNPRNNGMYYFNCRVQTPGDVPILRDLGTWILEIS
jgi:Protein of unknown function (DUF2808)